MPTTYDTLKKGSTVRYFLYLQKYNVFYPLSYRNTYFLSDFLYFGAILMWRERRYGGTVLYPPRELADRYSSLHFLDQCAKNSRNKAEYEWGF